MMTRNERLVWAATYADAYLNMIDDKVQYGHKENLPKVVELAWSAVIDMRRAQEKVKEGWGEDHEVYTMLEEMLGDS